VTPFRPIVQNVLEERERWFLWLPAGLGAGIALYFVLPFEPSPLWLLLAPSLAALAFALRRRPAALALSAIPLSLALGFNAAQLETWSAAAPMLERMTGPGPVTGLLIRAEPMPDGARLTLKDPVIGHVAADRTPLMIRIRTKQPLDKVPEPGERINLWAEVGPFSDPVAPGGYDFRRQAFFRRLGGAGWSYGEVRREDATRPADFTDRFRLTFERARRALARHVNERLSGETAAMTTALLNGEQTGIGKNVMQAMRASGLAHLLSISGVHVSMMGVLVYVPLRALLALFPWLALRFSIKKWAAGAAIAATSLYTVLVGPEAPTLRSALMTGIVMFTIIADRRAMSLRLVTLSAAVVMIVAPDGVMGPSFQMSFAAVLCMVAAFEKSIDAALRERHLFDLPGWIAYLWRHGRSVVLTSLVATAATTPFTLYHFQNFSFYGVVTNMIAIPLTSFWIMPCVLLTYLAAPFGWDGWVITGTGWGVDALIALAQTVEQWPFALLRLPAMPDGSLIAVATGGLWLCLWRRRWRYMGLLPILAGMLYPLYVATPDVFMTADGKHWAARLEDGRLAAASVRKQAFVTTQWQQRAGLAPRDVVDAHALDTPQLRCDAAGCVYRRGVHGVAFPALPEAAPEDCGQATVVLSPWMLKDCAAPRVIDEPSLWRRGAHTLTFTGRGMRVESARARRGLRPWSPGWKPRKAERRD
jgi:competence protein ComEC